MLGNGADSGHRVRKGGRDIEGDTSMVMNVGDIIWHREERQRAYEAEIQKTKSRCGDEEQRALLQRCVMERLNACIAPADAHSSTLQVLRMYQECSRRVCEPKR